MHSLSCLALRRREFTFVDYIFLISYWFAICDRFFSFEFKSKFCPMLDLLLCVFMNLLTCFFFRKNVLSRQLWTHVESKKIILSLVGEAIEIENHPSNLNREDDFKWSNCFHRKTILPVNSIEQRACPSFPPKKPSDWPRSIVAWRVTSHYYYCI